MRSSAIVLLDTIVYCNLKTLIETGISTKNLLLIAECP